jgi:hypothetical protein
MSDRETAARILEDAESRYFSRHKERPYILWSQEEDLIQAIRAALAAEREAIAKYCDLVEGLFSDGPPLGERIRRGWHLDDTETSRK